LRPRRREPRIMDWKIPSGFCVSTATSTDTDSSQMPTDSKGTHIVNGARVSAKFEEPDGVCYGTVSVLYSWSSHLHSQGLDRYQRTSARLQVVNTEKEEINVLFDDGQQGVQISRTLSHRRVVL
jgi:hypothetical protein